MIARRNECSYGGAVHLVTVAILLYLLFVAASIKIENGWSLIEN